MSSSNQSDLSFQTQLGMPALDELDQLSSNNQNMANPSSDVSSIETDYEEELARERTRIENILYTQGYNQLPQATHTLVWADLKNTHLFTPATVVGEDLLSFTQVNIENASTKELPQQTNEDVEQEKDIIPSLSSRTKETIRQEITSNSSIDIPKIALTTSHEGLQAKDTDLSFGKVLGVGGSGYVQLAWQHALEREVAVKRISGDWKTSTKIHSLIKEARLTGSLEHPNIIPIHLLGQGEDGEPLIVMKKVEGQSWFQLLQKDGPLFKAEQGDLFIKHVRIFLQVCRALEYTHSRHVLHLDIKPNNVMIGNYGEVYLVDWGVGIHESHLDTLSDYYIAGTPSFMASEMVQGLKKSSKKSDIALLGSTLHYLLMGEYRHQGNDVVSVLYNAGKSEPFSYPLEVHRELAHIINKACHKDMESRYQSVREFREAIEEYLEHRIAVTLFHDSFHILTNLEKDIFTASSTEQIDTFREQALTCRLTLAHCLRVWPTYQEATRAVESLLKLCCTFEIQQQNLSVAETYYNDLACPDLDLYTQLNQARKQEEIQAQEHERLVQLEESFSFGATYQWQGRSVALNGLFWSILFAVMSYLNRTEIVLFTRELNLYMSSVALCGIIFVVLGLRNFFMDTLWRRIFTQIFLIYIVLLYINRPLTLILDLTIAQSLTYDAILFSFFTGVLAAFVHPILWFTFILSICAIALIAHDVMWALDCFAILVLVANLSVAHILKPNE